MIIVKVNDFEEGIKLTSDETEQTLKLNNLKVERRIRQVKSYIYKRLIIAALLLTCFLKPEQLITGQEKLLMSSYRILHMRSQ